MVDRNRDSLTRQASEAGVQTTEDGGLAVADPERLLALLSRKTFAIVASRIGPLLEACGVKVAEVTSDAELRLLRITLESGATVVMEADGTILHVPGTVDA